LAALVITINSDETFRYTHHEGPTYLCCVIAEDAQ